MHADAGMWDKPPGLLGLGGTVGVVFRAARGRGLRRRTLRRTGDETLDRLKGRETSVSLRQREGGPHAHEGGRRLAGGSTSSKDRSPFATILRVFVSGLPRVRQVWNSGSNSQGFGDCRGTRGRENVVAAERGFGRPQSTTQSSHLPHNALVVGLGDGGTAGLWGGSPPPSTRRPQRRAKEPDSGIESL